MMETDLRSTGVSMRFIEELKRYCAENRQIEKAVLFGSRARGDFRRSSDIDLAISTNDSTHSQQNLIEHGIDELSTPIKINVVFMDRLTKENLKANIMREGIIIYEQGEALRKV